MAASRPNGTNTRGGGAGRAPPRRFFLTQSVYKVVLQKSIPAQIRQLILDYYYISNNKGYVDGFVGELTFAKRLYKQFDMSGQADRGAGDARGGGVGREPRRVGPRTGACPSLSPALERIWHI